MPALLLAEVHYEQNHLPAARTLIGDYLGVAHGLGYVDKLVAGYVTKARLEASEGQYAIAQQTLNEADRRAHVTGFLRLRANVLCERLRQLLLRGHGSGRRAWPARKACSGAAHPCSRAPGSLP